MLVFLLKQRVKRYMLGFHAYINICIYVDVDVHVCVYMMLVFPLKQCVKRNVLGVRKYIHIMYIQMYRYICFPIYVYHVS